MPLNTKDIRKAVVDAKEKKKKGNFTQTIDLSIVLKDIDLKQPKNRINMELVLPNEHRKKLSNICVCTTNGDFALRAKQEGLTVINKEALTELQKDRSAARKFVKSYEFFIASVEVMPLIARSLGPVLGPRGKMPLGPPKGAGIVPPTTDIKPLIDRYQKTIRIKMRKSLQINCPVGNEKMDEDKIVENISTVINFLENNLEKGIRNLKNISIKTTMGIPVKIEL